MSQRVTRSSASAGKKTSSEMPTSETKVAKSKKPAATAASKTKKAPSAKSNDVDAVDAEKAIVATSIYDFTVNDIKGNPISLDKYKGNVCIIVNVASRCGHTKSNYQQFVELHEKYADDKGLKILAFPCNQFGAQEPGSPETICKFVDKYNVQFDMFEKINVNGDNAHPLYKYLKSALPESKGKGKGDKIKWNFTKFIIDTEGKPVERFASATKPLVMVEALNKYW